MDWHWGMETVETLENKQDSSKGEFWLYIVVFAIVPYICRMVIWKLFYKELDFYISPIDLLGFCLAVLIAVFSDIRATTNHNMKHGWLLFFITGVAVFIALSLICEGQKEQAEVAYRDVLLKNIPNEIEKAKGELNNILGRVLLLFYISIAGAVITPLVCYSIKFRKK